jgi:uncharacterized protein (DUF58 family)
MARPTARGWGLLVVTACAYLAARIIGTWELYLLSSAFAAALLVSWLLVQLTAREVMIERTLSPARPSAGDALRLRFRVNNGSRLPGLQVTVREATGDLGDGDGDVQIESLPSRGYRVAVAGPWAARRGVHRLPALRVDAEDPLGLVCATRTLDPAAEFTVYPRLVELPSFVVLADVGRWRERGRRGLPTLGGAELRGIRPHYPGEPLSRVDWKATARTGALMLREMDDPASGDITVALDGAESHVVGVAPDNNFELAVQAAGSIAAYALRAGRSVSLLLQDDAWRSLRLSPHGDGRHRLLDSLARARPRRESDLSSSLQSRLAGRAPDAARTPVVTLVVLAMDERLARSIARLRETGRRVAVIYVDGRSFAAGPASTDDRVALLKLESAGVSCLTLRRGDDLRRILSPRPVENQRIVVT